MDIAAIYTRLIDILNTPSGPVLAVALILSMAFLVAVYLHRGVVALLLALPSLAGVAFLVIMQPMKGLSPVLPVITSLEVRDATANGIRKRRLVAQIEGLNSINLNSYRLQLCYRFGPGDDQRCMLMEGTPKNGENLLKIYPDYLDRVQRLQLRLRQVDSQQIASTALLVRTTCQ